MLTITNSKQGNPLLLHEEPIYLDYKIIGRTTSGNYSFNFKKNLAFGYIDTILTNDELVKKDLFIEKRIGQFDEKKSNFIRKTFTDKDLSFIEENFDYTVNMFDKKAQESLDILKEEAIHETKTQDAQVEVVKESSDTPKSATSMYAQELANMRL